MIPARRKRAHEKRTGYESEQDFAYDAYCHDRIPRRILYKYEFIAAC